MIGVDRVADLLSVYLAGREAGRPPSPDDLCRDYPELLDELNSRIRVLAGFDHLAEGSTGDLGRPSAGDTDGHGAPPGASPGVPRFERYEVLGELGRGGMGVVYRARDVRTGREVALKTMQLGGGRALELFKGEFRYLQGVSHPNLVQLYALEADQGRWLLTMEFVDGVNFRDHLRPPSSVAAAEETPRPAATPPAAGDDRTGAWATGIAPARPRQFDLGRLRDAFGQLAEGIAALHAHRRVHRDLKPLNVRVAHDGRVVVLDFGLTAALDHAGEYLASVMMGTAAYMAPEQGGAPPVATAASDWYAFGVMLYEALTGGLPFRGRSLLDLLAQKGATVPPRPRELSPDVPEELDALCMGLLDPRPESRPTGDQVLRAFGRGGSAQEAPAPADAPLLGRERHLAELQAAYAAVGRAGAVVVKVSGPSGIGKSALVGHFLDRLRADGAVVLSGRCYEHESVPYKALDPLVDELARYLHGLPEDAAAALVPAAVGPLVRVFPVLERVEPIARAAADARLSPDPLELRRQAFAGLRELLGGLARAARLVLHVDDLQWGDVDSAYLIADLIQPPDPPAALWVLAHRSEDAGSACLTTLAEVLTRAGVADVRDLAVAPLTEAETRALVAAALGPGAADRAAAIARESGGNPFFVMELVRSMGAETGADRPGREGLTLDGLIRSRVARLPDGARRLLELVAVSGRPLRDLDAYSAAGAEDARTLMARLEAGRFVRGVGSADELRLETYHDRVREAVSAGLDEGTRRAHHGRLADVLETSGRGDVEELALHFEGAGADEKAGGYYRQAADRAAAALAFDQAAGFYGKAAGMLPAHRHDPMDLQTKLGEALFNAGRGADAAASYLMAAERSEGAAARDLRLRAANSYLNSGRTDDALDLFRAECRALGIPWPKTLLTTIARLLAQQIRLKLRLRLHGPTFRERPADQISSDELGRIDVCYRIHAFAYVNPALSMYFTLFGTRRALRTGEPVRVGWFLANLSLWSAFEDSPSTTRAEALLAVAAQLNDRIRNPANAAKNAVAKTFIHWGVGHWYEAGAAAVDVAETARRWQISPAENETIINHVICDCLIFMGNWRQLAEFATQGLEDARRRGDRFATSTMLVHSYIPHLASGRVDLAEQAFRECWDAWPQKGNVMGGYWSLYGRVESLLYQGDGTAAWAMLRQKQAAVGGATFYHLIVLLRMLMNHLFARAAVVAAADAPAGGPLSRRARLLRAAGRNTRKVDRAGLGCSGPMVTLLRAGMANLRGQSDETLRLLPAAESGFDAAGMRMYAAAARRQRGRHIGGDEGRDLVRRADEFMTAEGVREPERIAHMLAPGFGD